MLWSSSEEVRRKAKDELKKYIAQTMSSSYEIVDEDYTHEKKGKEHEEKLEKGYLLSKYQMESLALRFSYDMEFYNRHPCEEME